MADTRKKTKAYCPTCSEEFAASVDVCPTDGTRLCKYDVTEGEDPLLGHTLDGRFRIEKVLGEGGMGTVYQAVQLSVDRAVAVKVLHSELSDDETVIRRFFREARLISGLSHHNIVNLIDFGQESGLDVLYLVMEMLQGRDLASVLKRGRLDCGFALDIIQQLCRALSEPHNQDITHRDLKPENLFLAPMSDGTVELKVLDFGIAQALQVNTKLTKTGDIFGTPHYMPPEQARGVDVGPYTDIYAMGVILFEMLTGQLPFKGNTPMQLMLGHLQLEPPSIRDFIGRNEVPDEVVQLVDQMLAKNPSGRPDSALDVRRRIINITHKYGFRPPHIDYQASYDEMFAPYIESGSDSRERAQSGQIEPVTGVGAERPGTDPSVEGTEELWAADTALASAATGSPLDVASAPTGSQADEYSVAAGAPDIANAPTEGLPQGQRQHDEPYEVEGSQPTSNRGLLAIAGFVVLLLIAGSGLAVYLATSSGQDEKIAVEGEEGTAAEQSTVPENQADLSGNAHPAAGSEAEPAVDSLGGEPATSVTENQGESGAEPANAAEPETSDRDPVERPEPTEQAEAKPEPGPSKPTPRIEEKPKPKPQPEPEPEPDSKPESNSVESSDSSDDEGEEGGLNVFPMN